ncbi:MAG: DNA-3-methyladenine glycosylase 2 family protein [Anderseniella sp.]
MTSSRFLINTSDDLRSAAEKLFDLDPRFRELHECAGLPRLRRREGGLEGLANIIVGQLISTKAAQVIWARVAAHLHPFEHEHISQMEIDELASLGLTRVKAAAIRNVANAVRSGLFSFDDLHNMDDRQARKSLVGLHGVGPWSADIYLMTCMGSADAWPGGDLAVRVGLQRFEGMETVPDIKQMEVISQKWRPVRAVAARYLWDYYASGKP